MARHDERWEASENTLAAQRYWTGHGYTFKLTRRFISKDYYRVSKDGVEMKFEVYNSSGCPIRNQMRDFERMFDMHRQVSKLEKA